MNNNAIIANNIIDQLGGRRFCIMTGAKNFAAIDNGVRFKIGRNATRTNMVEIKLNGLDLYDMEFIYYRAPKLKTDTKTYTAEWVEEKRTTIKEYHDVYCDQLQELFTEATGMYTHF